MPSSGRPSPRAAIGFVPRECIGLARQLRRRVEKEHRQFRDAAVALLEPFQLGRSFPAAQERLLLRRLAFQWRNKLPASSRLAVRVDLDRANRLEIVETRFRDSKLRVPGWTDDAPGVSIERIIFLVVPPLFSETEQGLVIVGLHAIGRRFERSSGAQRTDAAVLADLAALEAAWERALAARQTDFRVPALGGGHWRCNVMQQAERPVLAVRTFVAQGGLE